MSLESISSCPVCGNTQFQPFLRCEDFTSSHELFQLQQCTSCKLVFTNPRPDPAAISRYYQSSEYISHTGKGKGLIPLLYLSARKFTLRWKVDLIGKYKKGPKLLDYGCGTGEFLHRCSANGWAIAGIEPSYEARAKANSLTGINIADDISKLKGQKFDVITLWHVLEHILDLSQKLLYIKELLAENGTLLIAVPNHHSRDAEKYQDFWAGYDVPRHLWHFTPATMKQLLDTVGLSIRAIHPMKLDAYYVALLSQKYKSPKGLVIPNLLKGMISGFLSNMKARRTGDYSSLIFIVRQ